jgi:hypothetical protein
VGYAVLPKRRVWDSHEGSGSGVTGRDSISLPTEGDFPDLIESFSLRYDDGDHHVDRVGIIAKDGAVWIRLNDDDNDDEFSWWLRYHRLLPW